VGDTDLLGIYWLFLRDCGDLPLLLLLIPFEGETERLADGALANNLLFLLFSLVGEDGLLGIAFWPSLRFEAFFDLLLFSSSLLLAFFGFLEPNCSKPKNI